MAAKEILVIGGGASGLMAAVMAARRGAKVTVLEHQPACGKKILATGNGRCNLTNLQRYPDAYRSHEIEAIETVLRRFSVEDTLAFFAELGLYTRNKNGWIYPYSQQARTVLNVLLQEASRLNVKLETEVKIRQIQKKRGKWKLTADAKNVPSEYQSDAVILAAGSKASNLPGADGSGYTLAESLGHRIYPVLPALVPLVGEGDYFRQWEGLRMDAKISMYLDKTFVKQETGEIQLTGYGVSGIPVFQLSRYAVEGIYQKKRAELSIDFFPDGSTKKLETLLHTGKSQSPHKNWEEILSGIFPEKFSRIVIRRIGKTGEKERPRLLAKAIKHWSVPIRGGQDYIYAQVCMGGVDFRQVNTDTLESRLHKGLYFAGEILDVDGACGGYNLQVGMVFRGGGSHGLYRQKGIGSIMIRISQLQLPIGHTSADLEQKIRKTLLLRAGEEISYEIVRQSLDARKKAEKKFVYTIDVTGKNKQAERQILRKIHRKNIMSTQKRIYRFPSPGGQAFQYPPVVIGSGPAGLFCALMLAKHGYCPLVIERGAKAQKRKTDVERFWNTGILDTQSNVQFGEGGAGTFSDGKLHTMIKDPAGRIQEVLRTFVEAGAPAEILYQQKPHLGTDVLIGIVETIREQIEDFGGRFLFETQVTDFLCEDGRIRGLTLNTGEEIPAQVVVGAFGHSARDTFETLYRRGFSMEAKSFAVGVRVEHPQEMINQALYGEPENPLLGAASYKLTHRASTGRGVYSFCMCPGGYVVNASSEEKALAINGMSYQARDGKNANSALVVTVTPADYPDASPLGGVAYQRQLEQNAWKLANGKIPVQLWADYQSCRESQNLGEVFPSMKGAFCLSNLRGLFPKIIEDTIEEGMEAFERKISGFARPDCLFGAVESRTSSPVRILRDETMQSNIRGFYPCGEGAGYAGGITSAAIDGIKVAEAIAKISMKFQ